jgi:hypothetical protein
LLVNPEFEVIAQMIGWVKMDDVGDTSIVLRVRGAPSRLAHHRAKSPSAP